MITPAQYREAMSHRSAIADVVKSIQDMRNAEIRKLKYEVYEPMIQVLQQKLREDIGRVETQSSETIAVCAADSEKLHASTSEVELACRLIDISLDRVKNGVDFNFSVYQWSDRDDKGNYIPEKRKVMFHSIDILVDDKYKHIRAFIVPTGKPVKKYALFIAGHSIFTGYNNIFQHVSTGYINRINDDNVNVKIVARDDTTEKDLICWYEKNKHTLLRPYFEQHAEMEQKYEEATALYCKSKEWQILYLEYKKDYYENGYSRGIETTEYKSIIRQLEQLKQEQQ